MNEEHFKMRQIAFNDKRMYLIIKILEKERIYINHYQGLLDAHSKNQGMMGDRLYQNELEKNLKEQQVKDRL